MAGGPYITPAGSRTDVVVIGGGLAGISAAVDLAEAGLSVTLLEARPWLGGATCSFARRGLTIDNGQHAFLRCCWAYQDLLAKLGVAGSVAIQNRLNLTVLGSPVLHSTGPGSTGAVPNGQVTLRRSILPAPLHLIRALAGYRLLPKAERLKAVVAMAALRFAGLGPDDDDTTFGEWLADRGQDETVRQLLWDLLSTAALGLPADQADLSLAASAIRTALFSGRGSADIGVPAVPLSKLHSAPATALLSRLGARVLLGVRAAAIQLSGRGGYDIWLDPAAPGGAGGVPGGGPSALHAAGLVLAVPAWEASVLAPAELSREAEQWARLEALPVVSLHVIYGSPVTRLPYAAVVDSPVRWVVDKTGPAGLHVGQYLAASVPAADSYVDLPASRLRAELMPELERLFPAAADAEVQDFFITRERRALIRQVPGSQRLRAGQPPGLPGLALAGAWTSTGWPDTMEGAVRSGHSAALKVLSELTSGSQIASAAAIEPARPVASMARAT
jgi:squalene-associated FAD-dependent desaturase